MVKMNARWMFQCRRQYYCYGQWCYSYSYHWKMEGLTSDAQELLVIDKIYSGIWEEPPFLSLATFHLHSLFLTVCEGRPVVYWGRHCCRTLAADREPWACDLSLLTVLGTLQRSWPAAMTRLPALVSPMLSTTSQTNYGMTDLGKKKRIQ